MKKYITLLLCFLVVAVSGCSVTGPMYKEYRKSIPPVAAGKGRIFFYRADTFVGGGVRPNIKLNGKVVGESLPGGFFYVDHAPGKCAVSTSTEVERTLEFTLAPAEVKYVRTSVSMGFFVGHVTPELISPAIAQKALTNLKFAGKYDPNHPKQQ